jgi:hypothetical protein
MVAMPADIPVAIPVVPIVVTAVLLLVQVPPDGVLLNVLVPDSQKLGTPVIEVGAAITVTTVVTLHPETGIR